MFHHKGAVVGKQARPRQLNSNTTTVQSSS